MIRTHDAGSLRAEHVGQTVTLAGWVARRRDHGGVVFIDLRDAAASPRSSSATRRVAHRLRSSICVQVTGEVSARPEGNENPNLPTGEIEVIATDVEVLGASGAAAVPDRRPRRGRRGGRGCAHRYLDLRRSGPAAAMRLRSKVNQAARDGARTSATSSRSRRRR